jgi:threonine dehydratase
VSNSLVNSHKKWVVVVSGANMNFDRLRFVSERAVLGEGKEVFLAVEVDESPGRYVYWLS